MINFSIIIPHKNIPSLLERCVLSIPKRTDVQIIVIDDNSDKDNVVKLKSFEDHSKQNNLFVFYLNDTQARGAGHARNVGLEYAIGKWIIFADSDDSFEKEVLNVAFDKYMDSEADVVYFGIKCLDAETMAWRNNANQAYLEHLYSVKDAENRCRYRIKVPWGKFIKRDLVMKGNIKFDETQVGNDAWFSLQVGYWAKKIEIDHTPIYDWMVRKDSITSKKDRISVLIHLKLESKLNSFKEKHDLSSYRSNIFAFIPMLIRAKVPIHTALSLCISNISTKYILKDAINIAKLLIKK